METKQQMIVTTQMRYIHVMLNKLGRTGTKGDYVIAVTGGREWSCKELTFDEANTLISTLEAEVKEMERRKANDSPENKMRRKLIGCMREAGYNIGGRADINLINEWVLKYGYLHKPLNKYTSAELPTLVSQAEEVKKSFLKAV
jgi:hypothetical protein